jgi:magnesium-transporting ATPase (P-type)
LQRRPYKRDASLISIKMIRNITVQALFQIALLTYLLLHGDKEFGIVGIDKHTAAKELTTIVFNTFVFCQIFNEINARSIGDDFNVFKGLYKNPLFVAIIIFTVLAQYAMVQFGGDFVGTGKQTAPHSLL